ncbi:MAG: helix-turn-helix transcriptional regulator [Burkholderiaceae bacterium]|jgi:transcriptional regulator with XRE-family HTH domain
MNEVTELVTILKRELKSQGLTYRDVARALGLSEPSVKRLFSTSRFTVARLVELSNLLGFTLAELLNESSTKADRLRTLTAEQEDKIVSDIKLMVVAACVLSHWTLTDIVAAYRISEAECVKRLVLLDRMGLIELLPHNRVRLRVSRDFDWLPQGAIRRFFRDEGQKDFLNADFTSPAETATFVHGMLTDAARAQLQNELLRLRSRFSALHDEGVRVPKAQRHGVGLFVAMREWEPEGFTALRRDVRG